MSNVQIYSSNLHSKYIAGYLVYKIILAKVEFRYHKGKYNFMKCLYAYTISLLKPKQIKIGRVILALPIVGGQCWSKL